MFARFFWYWLQLQSNQWLPIQELEKIQLKKLKKILSHSYEKVPFYKKFYDQHRVRPNDLKSLEDLHRFPIITKELARDTSLEERMSVDVDLSQCVTRKTSGSTGIPVSILDDKYSLSYIDAYLFRRYLEYGYKLWEKICRTDTHPIETPTQTTKRARQELSKQTDRTGRLRSIPLEDGIEKNIEMIKKERPQILMAYPSYLRVLAKVLQDRQDNSIKPKIIMTHGEVLDEASRNLFNTTFDSQVYNGYGCIEVAPRGMAWECKQRSGLHINSDLVLLEVLKDGEPVSPEEKGEVVATSLFRCSTPMIRYHVGDICTLSDDKCACGREMPLIKNIEGRKVDFIELPDGQQIAPYTVMSFIQNIPGISRYQIIQETKNKIIARIEKSKDFDQTTIKNLSDTCMKLFSPDIQLEIDTVEHFPINIGRKFRVITSRA
ncbi:phenylacetate--CoA ligase family protein [[Eubacterium] cellulosolvens]